MDPPDFAAGGKSSPTSRELQGPRPAPLKLRKDSHKIKKSPQQEPPQAEAQPRRPVWIYSKSPRMIQATTDNFMEFVQRLTGASSTAAGAPGGNAWPAEKFPSFEMNPFQRLPDSSAAGSAAHVGDVSPARRLASIERTSPSEREKEWERNMNMVEELDMGFIPGILSPAPSSLAPVPTGFFSTECDLDTLSCSESRFIRGTIEERKQDELWFRMQINLADSRLSELPENPDCPFLEKLFLQQNSDLAAIPFSFFKNMPALQVLDLSDTSIKFLPPSVSSLVTLRELFVRDCQLLMELPPEIGALCNLRVLDLEGTKLIYLPKEIRMLLKLVCLKVSLYRCSDKYRESRGIEAIIPRATLSKFYYLKELSIDVDLHCGWWDIEVEAIIEDLCSLINLQTLKLYLPKVELLQRLLQVTRGMAVEGNLLTLFLPLTFSTLSNFRLIVGPHEQRIVSCLPVDLQVEFEKLEKCLKCVNGEGSTDGIRQVLKCTSALFLERHWSIEKLSVFKIDELDKLKFCLLVECNEMNAVVEGADFYDQQGDKRTNRADGKPALRLLQYLGIHYMKNLECVWRGSAVSGCLSSLIILDLHTCPNLFTIFSPLLLCNLTNLKELTLEDCPKVKSVICVDSCSYECLLPSLEKISLLDLPELVSIFSGARIAPKLERMLVYNCPKLKTLSPMETSSMKEIKGEREWWEGLEWHKSEQRSEQDDDYLLGIFVPLKTDGDLVEELAEAENLRLNTLRMFQTYSGSQLEVDAWKIDTHYRDTRSWLSLADASMESAESVRCNEIDEMTMIGDLDAAGLEDQGCVEN